MKTIEELNREIQQNPNDAEAYNNRGITHRNNGNFDQAIADLSKSIEINPNNVQPYYNRGLTYMNKGEVEKAFEDYNKVIQLDPKNAEAYAKRGALNMELGNTEEAIADFEEFLNLDPNNKNAKLVKDELEKLKSGDSDDNDDVKDLKKEIKKINVLSCVFGIIGVLCGIIFGAMEGGFEAAAAYSILGIWIGTGLGGGFFTLFESFGLFPFIFKRDGFTEACKVAIGYGFLLFIVFTFIGPLGWLVRVLQRKSKIKKLRNQ